MAVFFGVEDIKLCLFCTGSGLVEDCCGDVSQLAYDNAMKRVIQAGAKPVTAVGNDDEILCLF